MTKNEVIQKHMCRAKKYSDNKWIYGCYVYCKDYLGENDVGVIIPFDAGLYPRCEFDDVNAIIPDTVCRNTGLTDKNGTLIFEHDYVRTEYGRICEVVWFTSSMHCGWDLVPVAKFNCKAPYYFWSAENLEVVGNKFDNEDMWWIPAHEFE